MKTFAKVTGLKRSKGVLDNGKPYDNTTVYVEFPFSQSENMRGSATQPMKFGTSENFDKFRNVPLPFEAELDIEVETTGNRVQNVLVGVVPINKAAQKPAA